MIPSQPKPPTGSATESSSNASSPTASSSTATERPAKADRLSAALRDNLQRRKAQQRARRSDAGAAPDAGHPAEGDAD